MHAFRCLEITLKFLAFTLVRDPRLTPKEATLLPIISTRKDYPAMLRKSRVWSPIWLICFPLGLEVPLIKDSSLMPTPS